LRRPGRRRRDLPDRASGGPELDLLRDGEPQYRFDLTPRDLPDYEATCRYHQTSPESHFTRNTVCSLATPTGRVTIRGRTMIVTSDGHRDEHTFDAPSPPRCLPPALRDRLERLPPIS
jgi:arylamine N-acetyltransferase